MAGGPDDARAMYGPLNNADQLARVTGFIDTLPDHARVVTGGHRVGTAGYFFAPTIITDVRSDDRVSTEEMPHGGFKHSGYGKDLSLYGLEQYTRVKHVMHRYA